MTTTDDLFRPPATPFRRMTDAELTAALHRRGNLTLTAQRALAAEAEHRYGTRTVSDGPAVQS